MKTITLSQAKNLKIGTVLYHTINKNSDGSSQRWRVCGKAQTWKKDDTKIKIPVKNGLKNCSYLTENDLDLVTFIEFKEYHVQSYFSFGSDATAFQRKKQKEGYSTRREVHAGIANPYTLIHYWK